MDDNIEQFKAAMAEDGLTPPDRMEPGQLIRFPGHQKSSSNKAAWCVMFEGGRGGAYGDFSSNLERTWQARNSVPYTLAEQPAQRANFAAAKAQQQAGKLATQLQASETAVALWNAAMPCTQHGYLTAKGVQAYGLMVDANGFLMVPMRDGAGKLWNIERINPLNFKDKRGLPGGRRTGLYHLIGNPAGGLMSCEGYATGATLHEVTGKAVAVAFSASNLEAAARALRAQYPLLPITLAADDDWMTQGNPGLANATAAAQAAGGLLAVPLFPAGRQDKDTDFNDLCLLAGAGAVRACLDTAIESRTIHAGSASTAGPFDPWPELQPLIAKIEPQAYPLDALPDSVRCAVEEVAGFVKAPIPLIVTSALGALSLAIQAHTDVQRAEKLEGPCSLFLLAIADSGERKSTCDGFFIKAIRDYEAVQREAAKPLVLAYKSEHEVWEARRSGLKEKIKHFAKEGKPSTVQAQELHDLDQSEPTAPRVPRLIYGDATPEALAYSLTKQWPSGGVISSEAGIVFGGHGMNGDTVMRNFAMLNMFWDGLDLNVDRKSTDSFTAHGERLTMALQAQELTLKTFFVNTKGLARGTGFLARFLISWPASTQGTRRFTDPPANWPALTAFNERLTAILNRPVPINEDGSLTPPLLGLAPDAKAAWVVFHDAIESKLSSGRELYDVRDVASKTADNAVRLAALLHIFTGSIGPIGTGAVESGARIAAWHLSEARRFLGELAMPVELANPMRLEAWMLDYCKRENTDKVPTRELQRNGPGGMRDKKVITAAFNELKELGRARLASEGRKKLIQLNPAVLTGSAA